MNLYISLKSSWWGGGSNTFAANLVHWCRQNRVERSSSLETADAAILIADAADPAVVEKARARGCYLIHRLDEHFEANESDFRRQKHQRIIDINRHCQMTVFQSEFVRSNVLPFLKPQAHTVILNGGNPERFHPGGSPGRWIGHVTWGVGEKKRLDLLEEAIRQFPKESFLLIGNHARSGRNFKRYPNVRMAGRIPRFLIPYFYRRMKVLFFPSENDPCPNTAVEAVLSGVPVAFHPVGGTQEIVRDCGVPLQNFERLLGSWPDYRILCAKRLDLHFDRTARAYLELCMAKKAAHA